MKKILILFLAAILLSFCSCGITDEKNAESPSSHASSSQNFKSKNFNSEKAVIDGLESAIKKSDGLMLYQVMHVSKCIEQLEASSVNEMSESINTYNAMAEMLYEKKPNISLSIKDKTKLDDAALSDLQYIYNYNYGTDIVVEKGYALDVEMEICGEKDTIELTVYKIHDEGWKISRRSIQYVFGF